MTNLGASSDQITGNLWSPAEFRAYQLRDYLEFRSVHRSGATTPMMRLFANQDLRLYGELLLTNGGFRCTRTYGFTCTDEDKPVASFRSGSEEGDEVLRIGNDGQVTGEAGTDTGSNARWTLLSRTPGADTPSKMALRNSELWFEVIKGAAANTQWWGRMRYSGQDERILDTWGGVDYNLLVLQSDKLYLRNASDTDVFKFLANGVMRAIAPTSSDEATLDLDSTAATGGVTWQLVSERTSPYALVIKKSGGGSNGGIRFKGSAFVAPPTGSATIELDSSGGAGNKWQVISDSSSPYSLLFKDVGSGNKAAITASGGIRLEGRTILLKESGVTPLNSWSDPDGTVIIEEASGNGQIWVRFRTGSGGTSDDWWYANLTRGT